MATSNASAAAKPSELGALPEWDLSDLYPGRDSPELTRATLASTPRLPALGSRVRHTVRSRVGQRVAPLRCRPVGLSFSCASA